MHTSYGHLTYCSNIHPGESWEDHFGQLQAHIPVVKNRIAPHQSFGIGLRLSNEASLEVEKEENLRAFQEWLQREDCYVFTMNGFPYGGFHRTVVKDKVHQPDWTTEERVSYTIRLARILAKLLLEGMEGGISTSPLSYRFWHTEKDGKAVTEKSTRNLLRVVEALVELKESTGSNIHIDIEPEPDGLLGEGGDFFSWYADTLLPVGIALLSERRGLSAAEAEEAVRNHVQLCYDVCHFAVGYEDHAAAVARLRESGIRTGKIQISAALKAEMPEAAGERREVAAAFEQFNEPVYLHQVVARQKGGKLQRHADMPDALADAGNAETTEWRAHYHVPIFIENYGLLQSTQADIREVLRMHCQQPFTSHLEVETYTWDVLPAAMQLPIADSIVRELNFVKSLLHEL